MAGLSDEHRARIEAALPPGMSMTPEAWAELTEIVDGYRIFEHRRTTYPIKEERAHWKRLSDAVEQAGVELRRLRRKTPWSDPDPLWPNRALAALWNVRCKVETQAAFHSIWDAFDGRKNPHREFLYSGVMRVWTDHLGGELRYSNKPGKLPYGPLIRFMQACLEPVLGDETPRAGLANTIQRERHARAQVEAEKRRWLGIGF
jgi:hypothetical protein